MADATTDLTVPGDNLDLESAEQKSGFMDALGSVDMLRQIILVVALVICVAIAIFIVIWAQEPDYRPLAKLPTDELITTLDHLDASEIPYELEGNTILVPEDQYESIKLSLARQGLAQAPDSGTDIIMQDMGFGVSQRVEKERLKHAREQQIARTIEDMSNVSKAKVLLAMPRENVFARKQSRGSATVVITMRRGAVLNSEEVDAIVDMVASAVETIDPDRVTVTDSNGRLLNSGSQDSVSARSRKEFEIVKQREAEYQSKIDSILIPVLGLGNYTSQVDVSMDFTSTEQTQKRYNPDLPAVRSEMTVEENSVGSVIAGVPGALTNQPPLDANIPQNNAGANSTRTSPGRTHKEATRNFELDTTISHTKQQTGVIRRLSVSVAVDYKATTDAEGKETTQPRTQQELLNLRRLLQGGIGFDVTRGDSLEVVTIPFSRIDTGLEKEVPLWEQPWAMRALKLIMGGLIIIVLILAIVRPMLKRLIYPEDTSEQEEFNVDQSLDLGDETITMLTQEFDEDAVGFASDGSLMLPDLHKDEDVLKAVRALVANEPELSAQVVRSWLMLDE